MLGDVNEKAMNWRGGSRGGGTGLINKLAQANIDEVAPVDDELIVVRADQAEAAHLRETLVESTLLGVRETTDITQVAGLIARSRVRAVVLCWPDLSLAELHRAVSRIRLQAEGVTLVVVDDKQSQGGEAGREAVAGHAGADVLIPVAGGDWTCLGPAVLAAAERRAHARAIGDVIAVDADDWFVGGLESSGHIAVLAIEADNLQGLTVREDVGHVDTLMLALAIGLRPVLRPSDFMVRTANNCLIVVRRVSDDLAVAALADRLLRACRSPLSIAGEDVSLTVNIGISVRDRDEIRPATEVVGDARAALLRVHGQAGYLFFDDDRQARVTAQRQTEMALRHAIENHEFRVFYQPVIELATGRLASFEALMRWQRSKGGGLVYAASFVEAAQRSGLMSRIGQAILREAATEALGWPGQGVAAPLLSVNLSPQEYLMPTLRASVSSTLRELELQPGRVSIEIPRKLLEEDLVAARSILGDLASLGVTLVADDYDGRPTADLRSLPIQMVKLRMGLLEGIETDPDARSRLETVVAGAREAGWLCIGKGVETPNQAAILRQLGCHGGQGFLFSGARPAEDLDIFRQGGGWAWTPGARDRA